MFRFLFIMLAVLSLSSKLMAEDAIGSVDTAFNLGGNHKVEVYHVKDSDAGVDCYVSRAVTGGVSSWFGAAKDPALFSISCVKDKTTPIRVLPKEAKLFKESSSFISKSISITRFSDGNNHTLIYLAVAKGVLLSGSPFNSLSVVSY